MRGRLQRQAGLTLTELLVSLVLGLLLIAAVLGVFLGGLQTYRTTESLSRVQESGRLALEVLRQDLRLAGFTGCRQTLQPELPRASGPLNPNLIRNTLNPNPTVPPDGLSFDNTFAPILGFRGTTVETTYDPAVPPGPANVAGAVTAWTPNLPVTALVTGAQAHSDVVILSLARGGLPVLTHASSADDIVVPPDPGITQLGNLDIALVADCESAAVFQITGGNPGTSGVIQHNAGAGTPGNWTGDLGRSFVGARVFGVERVAYYIAEDSIGGRRALYRNDQELIENVERMRVEYGLDTNNDRRIDQYVNADAVPNWEQVLAIRVHLLISGNESGLVEAPRPLAFAGATLTPPASPGRRHYQVFTTTVGIRNRLP
jgi:type IV pilus assembly protein PilW